MKDSELLDNYNYCWEAHVENMKEINILRALYENTEPTDWMGCAENAREKQRLFRSAIVSLTTNLRASIVTDGRPRFYANPIYKENVQESIGNDAANGVFDEQTITDMERFSSAHEYIDSLVDDTINEWWKRSSIRTVTYIAAKDAIICGKTWVKLYEDDKKICVEHVRFDNVCEDPDARVRKDRRWVFYTRIRDTKDVEKEFDLKAGTIKADKSFSDYPDDVQLGIPKKIKDQIKIKRSRCRFVEGYITGENKIYTFVLDQGEQGDGTEKLIVLSKEDNPYPEFQLIDYIPDPDTEVGGRPIARDLACLNNIADRSMQQGLLNFESVGVAKIFCGEGDIQTAKKIDKSVGQFIPVSDAGGINYAQPPLTSPEGINIYTTMGQVARDVSGLQEVAEGKKVGRVESAKAYITLNEVVNRRVRPAVREWEVFLGRMLSVWGSMALNRYKKGTIITTGDSFGIRRTLPFSLSAYIDDFDCYIGEDSSLPKDPQSIANLYLTLLNTTAEDGLPVVTRKAVLEKLDIEHRATIIKDIEEIKKTAEQMKQMDAQIQQLTQQNQQFQQMLSKMAKENNNLNLSVQAGSYKQAAQMEYLDRREKGSTAREIIRSEGKRGQFEQQHTLDREKAELEAEKAAVEAAVKISGSQQAGSQSSDGGSGK